MELDFTKLNNLNCEGEENTSKTPSETSLKQDGYKTPSKEKNAIQGLTEGLQGISILQRQADNRKAEKERAIEVYSEYQKNIKLSGQLQTEILKGARAGEDIYSLFLKAVKAIALMTSNNGFYRQLNEDIRAIYGAGLLEAKPLEQELEEVLERLRKLRTSMSRGTEPADSLHRIDRAIKEHERRATQLKELIEKGGESLMG